MCRFLAGSSDSDSDNDRRVVKSEKDKRMGELAQTAEDIRVRIRSCVDRRRVLQGQAKGLAHPPGNLAYWARSDILVLCRTR